MVKIRLAYTDSEESHFGLVEESELQNILKESIFITFSPLWEYKLSSNTIRTGFSWGPFKNTT